MSVESLVVEASSRVASGSFDIRKSLIHVFENSELDDILLAIQRCPTVSKFFCNIETVRAIVDFVFESGPPPPPLEYEPPPSPSSPRKEQEEQKEEEKSPVVEAASPVAAASGISLDRIKVYCSELLTNTDSCKVFDVLMRSELLGYFFAFWQRSVIDELVFKNFLSLSGFMLQHRFHAFVRALEVWDFVIPSMVMQLDVPGVRVLVHALLANEAFLVETLPELTWSRNSILPLVVSRFRSSLDNLCDAQEVILMCEFLGELLVYHYRSAPHVVEEVAEAFEALSTVMLSDHTEFSEELFVLFVRFFPPKFGPGADELRPPETLTLSDLMMHVVSLFPARPSLPVVYLERIEVFLSSSSFQRWIAVRLSLETTKRLSIERWRALTMVARLLEMCSPLVFDATVKSGNARHFFDAFFLFPSSNMVHTLVADSILYLCDYASPMANCVLKDLRFLARITDAFLTHGESIAPSRPDFVGHVVRILKSFRRSEQPSIADLAQQSPQWSAVCLMLDRIEDASTYEVQPDPDAGPRGEFGVSQSPEMQKKELVEEEEETTTTEEVIEEHEEEVIEEVVEEVIEEVIEEE